MEYIVGSTILFLILLLVADYLQDNEIDLFDTIETGEKSLSRVLLFSGVVILLLVIGNFLDLFYPPVISSSFQGWVSFLVLGLALFGAGAAINTYNRL